MNSRSIGALSTVAAAGLLLALSSSVRAQFPRDSPQAKIEQRLGYGDVSILYHRPRVRGRQIWGGLVPYGEVWRTGADYPTRITFPGPVRVEGQELAAGTYALYTIPGQDTWTAIFSKNTELWGAFGYEEKDDALRVEVTPGASSPWTESFTIVFDEVAARTATLHLRWAELDLPLRLEVDIHDRLLSGVAQRLAEEPEQDWGFYWRAAKYLVEQQRDLEQADEWMAESARQERNWMNVWTLAELRALQGRTAEAIEVGEEAARICDGDSEYCPYSVVYRAQVESWREKLAD